MTKPAADATGTETRTETREPLDVIFRPRSIAVIGASPRRGSIGHEILHNLIEHEFQGVVFPVHPTARVIHSIKAYPSVLDIPDPIDLAVVVVPYRHVLQVAEECGKKGVRGLIVITAGFREVGGEGIAREEALLETVRRYGMQLVGPNCMGVINTEPDISMNATFAPTFPPPGPIGFMSQSGALGVTILDHARELGLGVSMFVSVGNKADVSGNKMIDYWSRDDRTRLIVMYNESFGDPRRFTRLARRVTKEKPILAVKAGRTRTGALAASSHTGALAGMDVAVDALFEQCGVIRATTLEELFDFAMAFANQPVPRGDRVAIITNAGGPGILTADACESLGLEIAPLTAETRARLRAEVAEEASVQNPVDLIASADAATYRVALDIVLQDPVIDAAIAIFVPPVQVDAGEVAAGIAETVGRHDKTVLGCLMGKKGVQVGVSELKRHSIPAFMFPESAARALAAMCRYRRWRERPLGEPVEFEVDGGRAAEAIASARQDGREHLSLAEVEQVLGAYGIPLAGSRFAATADAAIAAAEELGWPVALKVESSVIVHKTDVGGVRLGLEDAGELRAAFAAIESAVGAGRMEGVRVQRMVEGGRETVIGMTNDRLFGPLVMFGLGGIHVEVLGDVAFRIAPVSAIDAAEMVRSLRGHALLAGVRGERAVAFEALEEAILRVSQLVLEFPEIAEMDVNPFLAFPEKNRCVAVDGRIRLRPADARGIPGKGGQ
ncbi:MAG TPA: acetate--CoA ligase family protein [Gemmatimonadota bacterium]|nr:acetate--CoA ligase family protein [Gemmatimonadota bacterium]